MSQDRARLRLPVAGPSIGPLERLAVIEALERDWYEDAGRSVAQFERAFAAYVGRAFAVSLPSCTSGLHLVLAALAVGSGDEVVVPDVTWIATSAPISYVGATPVFADIEPETWCLSPSSVEELINERTRAIIAVDLYGSMPDWQGILDVADRHGIPVIEDAAEAIGSRYADRPAGSFGVASVFSFHGSKTLTTGEGGMVVTDDEDLVKRIHILRDHGRSPGDTTFVNTEIGFKYKMSSLQAALGMAQLKRVDELVGKKRAIFEWYRNRLSSRSDMVLNPQVAEVFNSYWMTTLLLPSLPGVDKWSVGEALLAEGIDTRPFFHPLSGIPAYEETPIAASARARNHHSYQISPRGLNLPSALALTEADVERVCDALTEIVNR